MSSHRSYVKVSRRSSSGGSCRGFRLRYSRRFSVHAFRSKFLFIFKILKKWTYAYCRALKFLKKGMMTHAHDGGDNEYHRRIGKMSEMGSSRSMNGLLVSDFMHRSHECRMTSLGRSNSFYSEAIADCLEFIKRNSVSDEDEKTVSTVTVTPTDEKPIENNLHSTNNTLCKERS